MTIENQEKKNVLVIRQLCAHNIWFSLLIKQYSSNTGLHAECYIIGGLHVDWCLNVVGCRLSWPLVGLREALKEVTVTWATHSAASEGKRILMSQNESQEFPDVLTTLMDRGLSRPSQAQEAGSRQQEKIIPKSDFCGWKKNKQKKHIRANYWITKRIYVKMANLLISVVTFSRNYNV